MSWSVTIAIIESGLTRSLYFDIFISSQIYYPSLAAMSPLAAWIPALLGLIIMMMILICFLGVSIYRLNTNFAATISRRRKEADATSQELADLTRLLHYIMTEAEKKDSIIKERNAVINEKGAVIEEKVAILGEKDAIVEGKDAVIGTKESVIIKHQLQINNLNQRLRRGATRAQNDQGEIRHLRSKLEKATVGSRKAAATENPAINQNAAEMDKMAMANQIIQDLQASLAAAGREAHEWRTEAYIAIVRKMPPSQRGLLLFGMDPRNLMPRAPMMQAYNPSARAPSFSTNVAPYPCPTPAQLLGLGPYGYAENQVVGKDCPREGRRMD